MIIQILIFLKRIIAIFSNTPNKIFETVQIETTSFCNAKCSFCPNKTLKRSKNFMSNKVFDLILNKLKKEKIQVNIFALHLNGEPLLDKKIFKRITKIKRKFKQSKVRFTTNFYLANKEIIQKLLASKLDEITISVNTTNPEDYTKIMGLADYNRTLNNISLLIKEKNKSNSNLKVNLSIVETAINTNEVVNFKNIWKDKANIRVIKLGQWVNENIPKNYKENNAVQQVCSNLNNSISFLSNGDFALCCFDAEGLIRKNIQTDNILTTYNSIAFQRIRDYQKTNGLTNPECKNCSFK